MLTMKAKRGRWLLALAVTFMVLVFGTGRVHAYYSLQAGGHVSGYGTYAGDASTAPHTDGYSSPSSGNYSQASETTRYSSSFVRTEHGYLRYVSSSTTPSTATTVTDHSTSAASDETSTQTSVQTEILAKGTPYATTLYVIKADRSGPTVMVVGGVHGDERAGYTAAGRLKNYTIERGKLLVLPKANVRAVNYGSRTATGRDDLNRAFPMSGYQSPDGEPAASIYRAVKRHDPDWLVDLHEGYDYYSNPYTDSVGQTVIHQPNYLTTSLCKTIVRELSASAKRPYQKFTLLRYPAKGSLTRSAAETLGVNAFIIETTKKDPLSVRVNHHLKALEILMEEIKMR